LAQFAFSLLFISHLGQAISDPAQIILKFLMACYCMFGDQRATVQIYEMPQ